MASIAIRGLSFKRHHVSMPCRLTGKFFGAHIGEAFADFGVIPL